MMASVNVSRDVQLPIFRQPMRTVVKPRAHEDAAIPFPDGRYVGSFKCSRIIADAGRASELLSTQSGQTLLLIQISGSTSIDQGGKETILHAGDVALLTRDQRLALSNRKRSIFYTLQVRETSLDAACVDWREKISHTLPRGSASMIMALAQTAFEQVAGMSNIGAAAFDTALMSLIGSAISEGSASLAPSTIPSAVRRIQNDLLANLNDADLSPRVLAKQHGLSERQLYRLFEKSGISLRRWIRQTRLDRCAADLRNPQLRERSITQIAFGYGFNDAAHFSRTFRAEFGQTPTDYRMSSFDT